MLALDSPGSLIPPYIKVQKPKGSQTYCDRHRNTFQTGNLVIVEQDDRSCRYRVPIFKKGL
jgi:hypothetical protein